MANQKQPRERHKKHLAWIGTLPCLATRSEAGERRHAAHIRYASSMHGKRGTGMGEKPSDCWAVPLLPSKHAEQHTMNERRFWQEAQIDPLTVAALLFAVSGFDDLARDIIMAAGLGRFPFLC